jgi:hypothetical protein
MATKSTQNLNWMQHSVKNNKKLKTKSYLGIFATCPAILAEIE